MTDKLQLCIAIRMSHSLEGALRSVFSAPGRLWDILTVENRYRKPQGVKRD